MADRAAVADPAGVASDRAAVADPAGVASDRAAVASDRAAVASDRLGAIYVLPRTWQIQPVEAYVSTSSVNNSEGSFQL